MVIGGTLSHLNIAPSKILLIFLDRNGRQLRDIRPRNLPANCTVSGNSLHLPCKKRSLTHCREGCFCLLNEREIAYKVSMSNPISPEEKARRAQAVANAAASMRLEGFETSPEAGAINKRYISGEITGQEQERLILALAAKMRNEVDMNSAISPEEKAKRANAVAFGTANVRLEGFTIGPEAQAINERYVKSEISSEEQRDLLFALAASLRATKG